MKKKYSGKTFLDYTQISSSLNSIIYTLEERMMKGNSISFFFTCLKQHLRDCKDNAYLTELLSSIYSTFLYLTEKDSKYDYKWWNAFPAEWKITKNNLLEEKNIIVHITLNYFWKWIFQRIQEGRKEFDSQLEKITKNIFPETDPVIWARILMFVLSPYNVKLTIESPWTFGWIGRMRAYWIKDNTDFSNQEAEDQKQDINKTIELALYLFKSNFSEENLNKYIAQIEALQYAKESREERKRQQLLEIFRTILNYLQTEQK